MTGSFWSDSRRGRNRADWKSVTSTDLTQFLPDSSTEIKDDETQAYRRVTRQIVWEIWGRQQQKDSQNTVLSTLTESSKIGRLGRCVLGSPGPSVVTLEMTSLLEEGGP